MSRVLIVQHEPFEGPGTLRDALRGCELRLVRTFARDPVPAEQAFQPLSRSTCALVVKK